MLFERLVDELSPDPQDPAPPADRLLDHEALRRSVGNELDLLFNTRAPVDAETLDRRRRSTLDYGIPDLSLYTAGDPDSMARLAEHLTSAVAVYEPRLIEPKVTVVTDPKRAGCLIAEVAGQLQLGDEIEPAGFRLQLGAEDSDG